MLLPLLAFAHLLALPHGDWACSCSIPRLTTLRVRQAQAAVRLHLPHHRSCSASSMRCSQDRAATVAALVYAGSALGAIFAGDLVTLLIFWEGIAVASVFLIWCGGRARLRRRAALSCRPSLAVCCCWRASPEMLQQTGSLAFGTLASVRRAALADLPGSASTPFPLLSNWLQDAYPEATGRARCSCPGSRPRSRSMHWRAALRARRS